LLQEFLDVGAAVVTIEQWGVDGQEVDEDVFMEHYTRSQRLADHCAVIDHIQAHPSLGWNGTFIFLGASEGGPLVTSLTERYQERALATINWCGAGDWGWRDELWAFLEGLRANGPWLLKILDRVPHWMPFSLCWPRARADYDMCMDKALADPTHLKEFMGMTYAYHADALRYPLHDYTKIGTPYLVVAGGQDTIIQSADVFVDKARAAGAPITYMRIEDMDHYVRHRPEIVAESFTWLLQIMQGVR
jgi:pimeloyl-ACP methyl ester carboxylesterase